MTTRVGQPDDALRDGLGHGDRSSGEILPRRGIQVRGVRSFEGGPARERHPAVVYGEEVGVVPAVRPREPADQDDAGDPVGPSVGADPGERGCRRVAHHERFTVRGIDGRQDGLDLIVQRRVAPPVALARQGEWHGAVTPLGEDRDDPVPRRAVEPQSWDQHDVHARTLGIVPDISTRSHHQRWLEPRPGPGRVR